MYVDDKIIDSQKEQVIKFISAYSSINDDINVHTENKQKDELLAMFKELLSFSKGFESLMLQEVVEQAMTDLVVDGKYDKYDLLIEVVNDICTKFREVVEV